MSRRLGRGAVALIAEQIPSIPRPMSVPRMSARRADLAAPGPVLAVLVEDVHLVSGVLGEEVKGRGEHRAERLPPIHIDVRRYSADRPKMVADCQDLLELLRVAPVVAAVNMPVTSVGARDAAKLIVGAHLFFGFLRKSRSERARSVTYTRPSNSIRASCSRFRRSRMVALRLSMRQHAASKSRRRISFQRQQRPSTWPHVVQKIMASWLARHGRRRSAEPSTYPTR